MNGYQLYRQLFKCAVSTSMTDEDLKNLAERVGLEWDDIKPEEFRKGLEVEKEHNDVTGGDIDLTAKIVAAHLKEKSNYYTLLEKIEE